MRERGTLVLSALLCGGLAIGSYWVAQQARLSDVPSRKLGHDVDYTADDITLTRMDANGRAEYTIDATKLVHYLDDDTGELTQPRMEGSKPNRPEMRVRADLGRTTSDGEAVRLFGNVVVTRDPWRDAPAMVAKSAYMLAYPDREVVETDQPIDIVRGGSSLDASSMHYDNATQRLKADGGEAGRTRTVIEPHHAPRTSPSSPASPTPER